MIGPEQAPTRAAVLELRQERGVVSEAYDFLDEKRLLLAAALAIGLHALLDFPLHVPAIAVLCATWVGLLGQPFRRS